LLDLKIRAAPKRSAFDRKDAFAIYLARYILATSLCHLEGGRPPSEVEMQFGMFFPHQLPRPWSAGSEAALFSGALDAVEIADRIGVAYAWAQEHHFLEEYSHSTAPEVFLGACSQRTKDIRLGFGISVMPPAVNHPARIAERVATLDLVSGGRVEWGTGEMSSRVELEGFGIPYVEKRSMWTEATRETARMLATEPYAGYRGRYFSMPPRNLVPKPIQRPHPPMWVACTNRDTLKLAARLGLGALTFAFMDAREAKFWVEEYYEVFKTECSPIAQVVNPNVATLIGFSCSRDGSARQRAIRDQQFFKFGLAHYYRFGRHVPGGSTLWEDFEAAGDQPMAGLDGVGAPEELVERFQAYEQVGVDQLILLQQAGRTSPEEICRSLELFGAEVIQPFIQRHVLAAERKRAELAPFIDRAMERVASIDPSSHPEAIEAYPSLWDRQSGRSDAPGLQRAVEASSLWNLHVGRRGKEGS
jgi:alkanesulfonate monooxygenase SsuD/methylene tetrahydromethanopterin reductase-like flavin-dependent oxidoreductase (luciferase family)